jgi:hypothetical protein
MRNEGTSGPLGRASQWMPLDEDGPLDLDGAWAEEMAPAPRTMQRAHARHVPAWDDALSRPRAGAAAATPADAMHERLLQLHARRDPAHPVEATLSRTRLQIGRDAVELSVRSGLGGRVHLLQAGSDGSLDLLFPNAMDGDNLIEAGRTSCLPRPGWRMLAGGPRGRSRLLVVVTGVECELQSLTGGRPGPLVRPFTGPEGRARLLAWVDRCTASERPRAFGSALLEVDEHPPAH